MCSDAPSSAVEAAGRAGQRQALHVEEVAMVGQSNNEQQATQR